MSEAKRASAVGRKQMEPLTSLKAGQSGTVARLCGGRAMQARLLGMGLYVGSEVRMLSANHGSHGPTLLAVGETRLAIGHGMAEKIMIRGRGKA